MFLLPIFATVGYSISPSVCGPLGGHWTRGVYGMEHPTGSNPAIAGEVRAVLRRERQRLLEACARAEANAAELLCVADAGLLLSCAMLLGLRVLRIPGTASNPWTCGRCVCMQLMRRAGGQ